MNVKSKWVGEPNWWPQAHLGEGKFPEKLVTLRNSWKQWWRWWWWYKSANFIFFLQISNKTNEIVSTLGFSFISKLDDKHMQICKTAQTKVHLALKLSHVKVQRPLKGESRRKKRLHLWKFSWFSDGVLRRLVVGTINLGKSQESPPIWEKSGQVRGNGDDGDLHATA